MTEKRASDREIDEFVETLLDEWADYYQGCVLELGGSQDEKQWAEDVKARRTEWTRLKGGR